MKTPYRNTIICDLQVIEQIITDYWNYRDDRSSSQIELSTSLQWFLLISSHSELIINNDDNEFDEKIKNSDIIKQLNKNSQTGGSKITKWKDHLIEIEKNNRIEDFPNAIYLLNCSEEFCNQKGREYGMIFLNSKNYKQITEKLFFHSDLQVKKVREVSDIKKWSDIKRIALPMNCLILTDNFIVKDADDITFNLIPLLDALLPEYLDKLSFQLIILTLEMDEKMYSHKYTVIKKQIKKLNRNFEIELSFLTASNKFLHDRRIFTNYGMFESNNSFTYFNSDGEVKKNTSLHLFPSCMISNGQEIQFNKNLKILDDVKDVIINHSGQNEVNSPKFKNRLLSMIK